MKKIIYGISIFLILSWFVPIIPTIKKVESTGPCITLPGYICYEKVFEWKTLEEIINHN